MNLARPFVTRPVASAMIASAIVLAGALSYNLLPVSPLPEVDFPTIRVSASLPGASPETIASAVATPLERSLGSIAGVTAIWSDSRPGNCNIGLEFELGRDINDAARDVQAAINAARGMMPSGMPRNPSYRKVNPSSSPIMAIALSSENLAPGDLYDFATTILAQKLSQVNGVGEVSVGGSSLPAIRVQLNPNALSAHGIALDEVRRAVSDANSVRPSGAIDAGDRRWQVQASSQLRRASQYKPLVIRYVNGAPVRLGDVAQVTDSIEDTRSSGFHNNRPAVLLTVSRQPGANIISTIDAINEQLPGLRALLPGDADLAVVMDRSPAIRAALEASQEALFLSAGLVMLVVFLFLGSPRGALIPSLAIPIAIIGTFGAMHLFGFSLNNISLMALIVAAGLVVDDAIVVLENVSRHIENGMKPLDAAIKGAGEVGFTLLAMNVSLIVVFVSIIFMGGLVEQLFREFSITLAAAMILSLLISLTLTPSLCARWLESKTERRASRLRNTTSRVFEAVRHAYATSLQWVLRHTTLTLLTLAGIIALNISLYYSAPKGFLPEQDTGQLFGFVRGDDGFSFQVMQPKIETFRKLVAADPAVQDVMGMSGGGRGISNAMFMIRLKPRKDRDVSARDVINRLRVQSPPVPGGMLWLNVAQDIQPPRSSDSGSYDLSLLASEVSLLREWLPRISRAMQEIPEITDVDTPNDGGTKQVMLTIDREAARRLGVDMRMITQVLNNSFSQRQIATLYDQLNQYRVIMELEPQYTQDPVVLDQVQVIAADGSRVPLSAFTKYDYSLVEDRVRHREQFVSESIGFALSPGVSLQEAVEAINRAMDKIMLPTEVQAKLAGTAETFQSALENQHWLILGVLVAVYLVLGILYESLVHPITILSTLPSAGLGALLTLRATGTEFTLIALLGLFLLIGIVMKNAILMIDVALERERKDNLTPRQAIYEAAQLRLRPILMTNLAALLGALPLVLASGEGVEMRRPLGLTIVGGLAVSQLLTLYSVPVVYLWLDRIRLRVISAFARLRARRPGSPAPSRERKHA